MKKVLRMLGLSLVLMVTGLLLIGCGNNQKKSAEEPIGEKTSYNVSFNSCGTEIACQQISDGNKAEKVYPHNDNHEFMGWYADAEYHDKFDFNHQVKKDLTLFAKWSDNLADVYEFEFANDFKSYMITKYYGEADILTLPNKFDDLLVTVIDKNVFNGNNDLRQVVIPESVVNIGENAFNSCTNLNDLQILGSIDNYGNGAFYDCQNLQKLYFAKQWCTGTYESGNDIFYNAGANTNGITLTVGANVRLPANLLQPHENVKLPKITTVDFIGDKFNVFTDDKLPNVKNIEIKDGVTNITNNAFNSYVNLVSVTLPSTIESIGSDAFINCDNLSEMNYLGTIDSWLEISFGGYFSTPTCWTKSLVINGKEITNVVATVAASKVSNFALYNCKNLKSIIIPNNVESIGEYALSGCTGLVSMTVPGDKLYIHHNNLSEIGANSTPWPNLSHVVITDGSEFVQRGVFVNCKKLKTVTLPATLKSIGYGAFYGCINLTSIEIPDGVLYIGGGAFSNTGLTSINIPKSVVSLGEDDGRSAFSQITTLKTIKIDSENTVYTSRDSNGTEIDGIIRIANGALIFGFKNTVIPDNVIIIGASAFSGCEDLVSVVIPNNVTSIGRCAFFNCKSLTSVFIPNSVTEIEYNAFNGYNGNLTVYCEAESKPSGWCWPYEISYPDEITQTKIVWGYQPE